MEDSFVNFPKIKRSSNKIGYSMVSFVVVVFLLAFYSEVRAQDPLELEETTVQTPADQLSLWLYSASPGDS
jgi:hypothetical protein